MVKLYLLFPKGEDDKAYLMYKDKLAAIVYVGTDLDLVCESGEGGERI